VTPHPAVARIIVPEKDGVSFGSGTLVDCRGEFGLIVTNWHVVRDASGVINVQFPDGFITPAQVVKSDKDWDLAALSIQRPAAAPVPVTGAPPMPGENLTIAGYGGGDYRMQSGRCTQYLAPGVEFPYEMVELDAEARQGDSGGPIFNEKGELAGVLFGSGPGYTSGSYGGRVLRFLATVVPGGAPGSDGSLPPNAAIAAMPSPPAGGPAATSHPYGAWQPPTTSGLPGLLVGPPPQATALHEPASPPKPANEPAVLTPAVRSNADAMLVPPPRDSFAGRLSDSPANDDEVDPKAAIAPDRIAANMPLRNLNAESDDAPAGRSLFPTPLPPRAGTPAANSVDINHAPPEQLVAAMWKKFGGTTFLDQAKTVFAMIGLLSVVIMFWRMNGAKDSDAD
jgi:hypothetical protein